jgi:5-methyltetrahydrofolate--homocysteine methyltransferase
MGDILSISDNIKAKEHEMVKGEDFYAALSQGNVENIKALTRNALNAGESPEAILHNGLILAMNKIGIQFKNNEIYIPEVMIAANACRYGNSETGTC